jgi:hypothetical protein
LLDFEARIIDRFDVLINGAGETQHIGNGQAPKPFPDVFECNIEFHLPFEIEK